jgi:hypothetical protein
MYQPKPASPKAVEALKARGVQLPENPTRRHVYEALLKEHEDSLHKLADSK